MLCLWEIGELSSTTGRGVEHYLTSAQGHISRDCTAPNGGPLSSAGKVCYKCSQAGHISRDCPTNNPDAAVTSQAADGAPAPAVDGGVDVSAVTTQTSTTAVA